MREEYLGKNFSLIPEEKIPCYRERLEDGDILKGEKHHLRYYKKEKAFGIITDDTSAQIQWPLEVLQVWKRVSLWSWHYTTPYVRDVTKTLKIEYR